jgi:hypothetical protein
MTKLPMIVIAVATLVQSGLTMAGDKSAGSHAAPNSYVPHPHASNHVYGTPIQPPVVGHARSSHQKSAAKKRTLGAARKAP